MSEKKKMEAEKEKTEDFAEETREENPVEAQAPATPETDVQAMKADMEKLKDQALRALADAENARRRAQKDVEETRKYAVSNFAKEMLTVADNFRRAIEAIPKEDAENEAIKHLVAGVEATERQLLSIMERFGIKKMDALGQPFDPNFHRVMMEEDDVSRPAGTVIKVFQDGYMIHDRLLREAMVVVTKDGTSAAHKVDTEA